ncbi:Gfo/Idh/MocA family oxidoreductase [Candidatus Bathyarchaeota archaeon]|nr:Gfo/Idh/MocA family oxidoreductase [Candidatus Bathyarchaeota archaeon]
MLRLGVVGCGRVTTMFHLRAIEATRDVEVAAVADVNEERMQSVKSECGAAKGYSDYRELLRDPDIDAVAVNTPPRFHEEMVLEALGYGKHVLCEKPLAETVEGCMRIKKVQGETGLVVLPGHNYAFTPCLIRLNGLAMSGRIGDVCSLSLSFENNLRTYRSQTDFRTTQTNGLVEDVLPHILSVSKQVAGRAVEVKELRSWCESYKVCDNMEVTFVTDREIPVECSLSWTKLVPKFKVEAYGSAGKLSADLMIKPFKVVCERDGVKTVYKDRGLGWYLDLVKFKHPSFQNQYRHFERLIRGVEEPLITVDDEAAILRIMEKVSAEL